MQKLFPEERLAVIMEIIGEQKKVDVETLANRFGVTGATIRSDLRELHSRQLVRRTHGGAVLNTPEITAATGQPELNYRERTTRNGVLKRAIGAAAASLVRSGDSILIDDGTTTIEVVRALSPNLDVTLLTNGIEICLELIRHSGATAYSTGGKIDKSDYSFYGRVAIEVTRSFSATMAILGASGVSIERGISTPTEEKAELKQEMIRRSERVIIVADHTKLDRTSFLEVCALDAIDILVTDDRLDDAFAMRLKERGVDVVVAQSNRETDG